MFRDRFKTLLSDTEYVKKHFDALALELYEYQSLNNPVYKDYCESLGTSNVKTIDEIPLLPISAFKSHKILINGLSEARIFESSGTTAESTSKHYVQDLKFYESHSRRIFENYYGSLEEFRILALLPSYLERNNSSLVYMVNSFIETSKDPNSGFYLHANAELINQLKEPSLQDKKTLLIGVSFALLDLAEHTNIDLSKLVIMETGGMKGRRKELSRNELHEQLCTSFNARLIHSEYGMTELLSQCYSQGNGIFEQSFSMKIQIREINDPLSPSSKTGMLGIIDLGNVDSCAFILTDDLARMNKTTNQFEVLGRLDQSDIRGCNLMLS